MNMYTGRNLQWQALYFDSLTFATDMSDLRFKDMAGKPSWVSPGSGDWPCGDWTCEWPCCVMLVRNGIYSEYSIPMYMRYIAYMRYYILYVVHVYIMCTMVDLHTALLDYMWTFTLSSQYVSQAQDSLGSSPASTKITFGHLRLLWPDIPIKNAVIFHSKLLDSQRVTAFDMLKWRVLCWNLAINGSASQRDENSVSFSRLQCLSPCMILILLATGTSPVPVMSRIYILVGGLEHFYFPIYWKGNNPIWLSYFSEG